MDNKDNILDELLIMEFRAGDTKSLSLFVKRWHLKLVWFSYQTIHNTEEAQDIVQDSWAAIIRGLQNINEIRSYRSWMYRVIRNKSIDKIRQLKREQLALNELKKDQFQHSDSRNLDGNAEVVLNVLQNLSADLKEVIQLFYLRKQSVQDIAIILSIAPGTVKSRLFRAREQMKSSLLEVKHLLEF